MPFLTEPLALLFVQVILPSPPPSNFSSFNWPIRPAYHVSHHRIELGELPTAIFDLCRRLPSCSSNNRLRLGRWKPAGYPNSVPLILNNRLDQFCRDCSLKISDCASWRATRLTLGGFKLPYQFEQFLPHLLGHQRS